jgi:hypothetical protein
VNTEPLLGLLATVTSPPIMRASLRESARPSPVPPTSSRSTASQEAVSEFQSRDAGDLGGGAGSVIDESAGALV